MNNLRHIAGEINEVKELKDVAEILFAVSSRKYLFFNGVKGNFTDVADSIEKVFSLVFSVSEHLHQGLKPALILLGANMGFCGNFNNLIKGRADEESRSNEYPVLVEVGRQVFSKHPNSIKIPFPESKKFDLQSVFEEKEIFVEDIANFCANSRICLVYNRLDDRNNIKTTVEYLILSQEPEHHLHLERRGFDTLYNGIVIESFPEQTIAGFINYRTKKRLLKALIESETAENFTRLTVMNSAKDESENLIKQLTKKYNKARQAKITNEMTEIINSFKSLKAS